ncbi:MAG: nitrilase [Candidatus Hydrogenedentota bacterium]|nr:MAG: nitrilase [Candidatus Hydrogenedentota bacterium]
MDDLRVAAVVMRSRFGETQSNLRRMEHFVREAARCDADVVCFPEMGITGYALKEEIRKFAEPVPGPSTREVQRMADENGIVIIAGLAERTDGDMVAITQTVVCPNGDMGLYRKLHLSLGEQALFQAGCEIPVFRIGGTTFGMELCYDAHFPELSTLLALKGAELLFMPHASPPPESSDEKRDRWLRYLSARAYDNSAFVVACNQTGDGGAGIQFAGVAMILDPRGEIIAETSGNEENMVIAELKAETLAETRSTRMGFFLEHRRPELYRALVAPVTDTILERPREEIGFGEEVPGQPKNAQAPSNL